MPAASGWIAKHITVRLGGRAILSDVSWAGEPWDPRRRRIGYAPEERGLWPRITVAAHLETLVRVGLGVASPTLLSPRRCMIGWPMGSSGCPVCQGRTVRSPCRWSVWINWASWGPCIGTSTANRAGPDGFRSDRLTSDRAFWMKSPLIRRSGDVTRPEVHPGLAMLDRIARVIVSAGIRSATGETPSNSFLEEARGGVDVGWAGEARDNSPRSATASLGGFLAVAGNGAARAAAGSRLLDIPAAHRAVRSPSPNHDAQP